jgi:hypothetical protein
MLVGWVLDNVLLLGMLRSLHLPQCNLDPRNQERAVGAKRERGQRTSGRVEAIAIAYIDDEKVAWGYQVVVK